MKIDQLHYERLRFKIKLRRFEKHITVRELSSLTNISYSTITRIEQGLITPTDEMIEKLSNSLEFEFFACEKGNHDFEKKYNRIYDDILYARLEPTHPVAEEIYEQKEKYENCHCFHKYYLIIFMYTQHLRRFKETQDDLYEKLVILEELYEERDREILYIELAVYFINKGDRQTSVRYLDKHLEFAEDLHLIAFNNHIRGIIYAENHNDYDKSLMFFKKAAETFQQLYNFTRLMQTKIFEQRIFIYMNRFEAFKVSYNYTNRYSQIKRNTFLYERSKQNIARFHLANRNYDEALKVLNTYKSEYGEHYCFKAYVLFQQKYGIEALHTIQSAKKAKFDDRYGHMTQMMDAMEYALIHGRDDEYLSRLKKLSDLTLVQADFILVKMSIKLYTEALEEKRQYKEAYIYIDKLLQAMRNIMRRQVT